MKAKAYGLRGGEIVEYEYDPDKEKKTLKTAPPLNCPNCGQAMEKTKREEEERCHNDRWTVVIKEWWCRNCGCTMPRSRE